jgi:hypothetical protein
MPTVEEIRAQMCRKELPEASLKELANAIAALDGRGFSPKDVFPVGIVIQEGAGATFEVELARLGEIVEELAKLPSLRPEIRIFPLGIIVADRFEVRATIGRGSR